MSVVKKTASGMLLKDDVGNYYFLRREILEATKIPAKELAENLKAINSPGFVVRTPLDPQLLARLKVSTVMCAW